MPPPPPRQSCPRPLPSDVAELKRAGGRLCRIRGPEHLSGEVRGLLSILRVVRFRMLCAPEAAGPALRCGPRAAGRLAGASPRRRGGVRGDGTIVHEGGSRMTAAETPDKARASPPPASLRAHRESSAASAAARPEAPGFGALPATWPPPDGGGAGPWRSALEPPPPPLFLPAEALTTRPRSRVGDWLPSLGS